MPDWPDPPQKGYQRIAYERVRRLSGANQVDLFFFRQRHQAVVPHGALSGQPGSLHSVRFSYRSAFLSMLRAIPSRVPFQVAYYRSTDMKTAVDEAFRRFTYDAVIVETVRLAQYVPADYKGVTILDAVDPLPISYLRSLAWRPWFMRSMVREEASRLLDYERGLAPRFSHVLLVSSCDAKEYCELLGIDSIQVVPHGVDAKTFKSSGEPRTPGAIVFAGNLGYAPNVDAVSYFCREIFPLVLAGYPNAELWLVGARPARRVRQWARTPNVKLIGPVPDVRPYLARAAVSVCPVRQRAGMQNKLLEAMAMGTPAVSTRAGIAGLGNPETVPVRVADTPGEFAACVVSLLRGEEWDKFSAEGRRFVETRFNWESSVSVLERLIAGALR